MNRPLTYYLQVSFIWMLYLPFVFVSYCVAWLDRRLQFRMSFPRNVAALAHSQGWCVTQLKKCGALPNEAAIDKFEVEQLNEHVIFRSNSAFIKIHYHVAGEARQLKCFAKFAPIAGSVWNRTIFNLQMNHLKEISFNKYFASGPIPAPKVYYAEVSAITGNLCLINEFMEDCLKYEGVHESPPFSAFEMVMEGLATLHATYWHSNSADIKRIMPITDSTVYLFDSLVSFTWSLKARNVMMKCWRRMNEHETALHGDVRLGNMMIPYIEGKGRFVFIDWQAFRLGKAASDLAYFLILSLRPDYRLEHEQRLIEIYYDHLVAKGVKPESYPFSQLEEDYRHATLFVLILIALPMLSSEVSADGEAARTFKYGMGIWRERAKVKFSEFDYAWMADRYNISEQDGCEITDEMLGVIQQRLNKIQGTSIYSTPQTTV